MRFPIRFGFGWIEMATALQAIRENMSRRMGDYREGTTTSLAGTALLVVDTDLADRPNDYYKSWWVKITSGTDINKVRRVSAFTQSTGTLTVYVAFSAAIAASVTYELHRINPDDKDTAIKQVIRSLYPSLYKPFRNETLIAGNWLKNGNFEDWTASTNPDGWTYSASMTATKETAAAYVAYGASSVKMVTTGTAQSVSQGQGQVIELRDLRGQKVTFRAWMWCNTASHARLQIADIDESGVSTTTNSDYHTGNSRWRLLEVERTLPSDLSTVDFHLRGELDATTAYADQARVYGPEKNELYLPASGWKDIRQVDVQVSGHGEQSASGEDLDPCDDLGNNFSLAPIYDYEVIDDGTDKRLRFQRYHERGYKVVLRGMAYLTQPSSDTATTEVDEPQVNIVAAMAIWWLYSAMPHALPADEITRAKEQGDYWKALAEELRKGHGMKTVARIGKQAW